MYPPPLFQYPLAPGIIADAQRAGFSELTHPAAALYTAGGSPVRLIRGVLQEECAALFDEWLAREDRRVY